MSKKRTPVGPFTAPEPVSVIGHPRWRDMQVDLLDPAEVPTELAEEFIRQLNNPAYRTIESILHDSGEYCMHWLGETAKGRMVFPVSRKLLADAGYAWGYDTSRASKAKPNAPRVSFFIFSENIAHNHQVRRICDTRTCVHPKHLEQYPATMGPK